jgi:branched-chain amino acid aminotransferase
MTAAYPTVFFGGRWVTRAEATVPIGSLAMRYGVSVFEGIRLYTRSGAGGMAPARPFLLDEHVARLINSLALMRLSDPGVSCLPELIDELVERNDIRDDAYVRASVTPTNAGDLDSPAVCELAVTAVPMARKRWLAQGTAMSLAISQWQRAPARAFPPAAKNVSNYAGPRLAWLAARDAGFDGCVLTNSAGRLCEAPTAALFLVKDGRLLTPRLSEDVLPSITRAWVLRTARRHGIPADEATLTAADAYAADEAFLCGTGIEIAPVRAFDGRLLGGRTRPGGSTGIVGRLVEWYFAAARQVRADDQVAHR